MNIKKKIIIWVAAIVVLAGGFLAFRIPGWNQTFGLSEDVIAGKVEPSAEETVRLYFYYRNRCDHNAAKQLETDRLQTTDSEQAFGNHAFWDDLKLLSIKHLNTYSNAKEWGNAYKVMIYEADFNEGVLYVSSKGTKDSEFDSFIMIQVKKGDSWKIDSIGKG